MNTIINNKVKFNVRLKRSIGIMLITALMIPLTVFSQFANPPAVPLLTAETYGALAFSGITGSANVNGDVGTTSATIDVSITQSGTNWGVGGQHNADAHTDLTEALTNANGRTADQTIAASALGGLTLGRGVYSGGALTLASNEILTLSGTATDVFIFQTASTLTINTNSTIVLEGGVVWTNVFWYVGSSATIFSGSTFNGIILASVTITVNTGASLVTSKLFASTGAITINSDVLPVELTTFTAVAKNTNTDLYWSTAMEVNNFGFEIQRAMMNAEPKMMHWSNVGFVEGNGTTSARNEYFYSDKNISSGNYSYRLKQIDRDGQFEYSQSVEVTIGNAVNGFALAQNYPNPFNPSTTIQFSVPATSHVTLKIFNQLGQEVATLVNAVREAGIYKTNVDASLLSSGMYIYRIQAGMNVETKRMTVLK